MQQTEDINILFNRNETILLYFLLKSSEEQLDNRYIQILTKIEKKLYEQLSIQEIENIKNGNLI